MPDVVLRLDHVYKKFARGERHDSLRDFVPTLARQAARRAAGVALRPEEFWVLDDISLEVERGQVVGIVGHNGAGKSTLIKHLCGVMRPTRGRIEVQGRLSALIEVGAGFHPDLTGRENIYLNGVILGMSHGEVRRKFDEIVEFSGLEDFLDTPVKRYSSGMYARLGFSVAAHLEPDILVVDEVLSVGDFVFQKKGLEKMRSMAKSGATVIFVSHNLHAISDLCQRAFLLRKGRLVDEGLPDDVIRSYVAFGQSSRADTESDVSIERVTVRGTSGPAATFDTGDKAWVDVDFVATRSVGKLVVEIDLKDRRFYEVFTTSSQGLGCPVLTMKAGERRRCTFELDLHLARGTFILGAGLVRRDSGQVLDEVSHAATLLVHSDADVGGCVNLYPRATIDES